MKKLYTVIGSLLIGGVSFAQIPQHIKPLTNKIMKAESITTAGQLRSAEITNPVIMATLLSEDFQSVTAPALPAGWTTSSMAPAGGFMTGTAADANGGGYWPVVDNGQGVFAMTNDDVCNCDMAQDYMVLPTLDFSTSSNLVLSFEYVDDQTYGGAPSMVQADTGTGTFFDLATLPVTGLDFMVYTVPLSVLDGQSSVTIRFWYNDGGTWATGLAIDNIFIGDPPAHFTTLNQTFYNGYADSTSTSWYTDIPFKHASQMTLTIGGVVGSFGSDTAKNAMITATAINSPITYTGTSAAKNVAPFSMDSMDVTTGLVPNMPGDYTIAVDFTHDSLSAELSAADNSDTMSFTVTTKEYSRVKDINSLVWWGADNFEYRVGTYYEIMVQDTAYSIEYFVSQSAIDKAAAIQMSIWDTSWTFQVGQSDFIQLDNTYSEGWYTFALDAPVPLDAGAAYLVTGENFTGDTIRHGATGAGSAPPLTNYVSFPGEDGGGPSGGPVWYYISRNVGIKMISGCNIGVSAAASWDSVSTGGVTATVTGGTSPFGFTWSNGQTGSSQSGLNNGSYYVTVIDADGCAAVSSPVMVVGVDVVNAVEYINAYPNPTNGRLNLEFTNASDVYTVRVTDIIGNEVIRAQESVYGSVVRHLDLSSLNQGAYFVTVTGSTEGEATFKVIVK